MEELEKLSERKKSADINISNLERNLNTLKEDNGKLKSTLELYERDKKLLEKNMIKLNGNNNNIEFKNLILICIPT